MLVKIAADEIAAAWAKRIAGKPIIELRALRLDTDGRDSEEQLRSALIFEAALFECLLEEHRCLRPVLALDADLSEAQVET